MKYIRPINVILIARNKTISLGRVTFFISFSSSFFDLTPKNESNILLNHML